MGKKRKLGGAASHRPTAKRGKHAGATALPKSTASAQRQKKKHTRPIPATEPTIPFAPEDKILIIGDGDLSFGASLVEHHYCADVTATVLEKDLEELIEKYPHAAENIAKIEAEDGCRVMFGLDATKMAPFTNKAHRKKDESTPASNGSGKVSDAPGIIDRIIFNFPHVGGKSTDVNRQVRYNQELLVSFFQRANPSLAPGGTIIVTLFEGDPYTLWNVRDLARHSGLQVVRSFRFQASAYPGYHHARTLGVVRNRDGEVGGGWKGEDRPARSYCFMRKGDEAPSMPTNAGKKRPTKEESDSSDDE
ncbi:hypothetical protein F5Y18DRAFT_375878 [Xylariaceae sp. FL1019]|nr:hypothetical protein F5Y18DRAFT_375878 [Xylariaceae sp. FL1019]